MGMFNTPDGGLFLGIKSDRQYKTAAAAGQKYADFVAEQTQAAYKHRKEVDARLEQNGKPINTFNATTQSEAQNMTAAGNGTQGGNGAQEVAQVTDPAQPVDAPAPEAETVFDESAMAGAFEEGFKEAEAGFQSKLDEAVAQAKAGLFDQAALDAKVNEAVSAAKQGMFDQATLDAKVAEAKAGLFDQATIDAKVKEAVETAKQTYISNLNSYLDGDDCADIRAAICDEVLVDTPAAAPANPEPQAAAPAENQAK